MSHPLDRPVWNAFTGRQEHLAIRRGDALRVDPAVNVFAATADLTPEGLRGLVPLADAGGIATVELEPLAPPPGLVIVKQATCVQMIAERHDPPPDLAFEELGEADGPEMLALALLTEPGPFRAETWRIGGFIGVRREGRLIAMAGRRMQPNGYVEVSGVCTHPYARGQGLAGALMSIVADRIVRQGDTPFLHAWSSNAGAIALYERLGYRTRRELWITMMVPAKG